MSTTGIEASVGGVKETAIELKLDTLDAAIENLGNEVGRIIGKLPIILSPTTPKNETEKKGQSDTCALGSRLGDAIRKIDSHAAGLRETSDRIQI